MSTNWKKNKTKTNTHTHTSTHARGKKTIHKGKIYPLPFEKWICRNDQQVRDDDRRVFVAMISSYEQRWLVWAAMQDG